MASLYEQLMAAKGAPKAAAAPNSTQLRKAPVSLRSAMRKYAAGGDVADTAPDYSRAYGALGGAEGVNALRNQLLGMGISEDIIGSSLSKYYTPEPQHGMSPQALTPPPPPPEESRYQPEMPRPEMETRRPPPPPEPRYEEPPRPIAPDREAPYIAPQQPQGPRTSYRQNADGTLTEIGYNGDPISGYTPEQLAMHNATTGVTPPEYRYVWNGEGYDKLPNGPQIGYNPEENVPPPPREDPREEPRYYEPDPEPIYEPTPEPRYYEPPPEIYPQYPEEPSYYQPPVYDNPAIEIAKGLQGGDIGKVLQDLASRGQTSQGISALIAKALASGGNSLEGQRKLMELLGSIKG